MTLDESIQGLRLRVMRRAEQVGNVSQVCREFGISRTLFYRWRRRIERYGADGLHPRRTQGRRGSAGAGGPGDRAPGAERGDQRRDLGVQPDRRPPGPDVAGAAWRPARCSGSCAGSGWRPDGRGWRCSSSRRSRRWGCSPSGPADACGAPATARRGTSRRRSPASSSCLDTFYIGQLKGVGKVWQITACDAFGSYGVAWLLPAFTATAAATFLRTVLLPQYRRAGLADSARADGWRLGVQGRLR